MPFRVGASIPLLTTAQQRLLTQAAGGRTHADWHQAVIGRCRLCWSERPLHHAVRVRPPAIPMATRHRPLYRHLNWRLSTLSSQQACQSGDRKAGIDHQFIQDSKNVISLGRVCASGPHWVNSHAEHHLFTQLPGWQLPEAHTLLRQRGRTAEMAIEPGCAAMLRLATSR